MQTILGSGGAIGTLLAKELAHFSDRIRLVSRNPHKVNDSDMLYPADLLDKKQVLDSVEGSQVVYVTIGFPYSSKIWQKSWPIFIDNVIEACATHKAKLVFFDNIYMYDPSTVSHMTEENPVNPKSKKGQVRRDVASKLMNAVASKHITALIARSADFYGPQIKNTSILNEVVLSPLSQGKKASWLGSAHFKHSFTYTPDAAKATALLGNTEDAYNQVWHLPTAANPLTGAQLIELAAKELGVKAKYRVVAKGMLRLLGLFIPMMRELVEMNYQYEQDYIFNSDKFEKRFSFSPTPYEEGIRAVIESDFAAS